MSDEWRYVKEPDDGEVVITVQFTKRDVKLAFQQLQVQPTPERLRAVLTEYGKDVADRAKEAGDSVLFECVNEYVDLHLRDMKEVKRQKLRQQIKMAEKLLFNDTKRLNTWLEELNELDEGTAGSGASD